MHTSTNFVLRGGDAAFANRQKLLFDQLSIAESKCNNNKSAKNDDNTEMHIDPDKDNRNQIILRDDLKLKRRTKRFCGKESIFKRPEGPAPRANFRNIPDYHRNPHKWVKYSLEDVSSEDMTERSNTQAAMSFLRELKIRKKSEEKNKDAEKMDVEPCKSNIQDSTTTTFKSKKHKSTSQIIFKKPQKEMAENSEAIVIEADEKPVFKSSKIILPEYVIGQKPKKISKQKQPSIKIDRTKELRLDHLEEPDEEDN